MRCYRYRTTRPWARSKKGDPRVKPAAGSFQENKRRGGGYYYLILLWIVDNKGRSTTSEQPKNLPTIAPRGARV